MGAGLPMRGEMTETRGKLKRVIAEAQDELRLLSAGLGLAADDQLWLIAEDLQALGITIDQTIEKLKDKGVV
jgi:hypothetical protein